MEHGGSSAAERMILYESHPNPFTSGIEIAFYLPAAERIRVDIYNVLGQRVETLLEGWHGPGVHSVYWDAGESASGVYFSRVESGKQVLSRKLLLVR